MANFFDYKQFEADLFEATADCYGNFSRKKANENVCAFALYSDESASSVSASVNTSKHLAKTVKEEPEDALYYKWSPAEWKYEGVESKKFDVLSRQLMEVVTDGADNQFADHRTRVFEICVRVLQRHKQADLFSAVSDDFILMFDVSDYSSPTRQIEWIKSLNDAELSAEFEQVISEDE